MVGVGPIACVAVGGRCFAWLLWAATEQVLPEDRAAESNTSLNLVKPLGRAENERPLYPLARTGT